MPYTAQVLSGETPLEALKTEWRDLFDAADSPNPFLSAEWVFAWLKHIEPHLFPITLIVRDENEKLAAAWPFFEYPAIGGRGLWAGLSDTAYILDPLFISNDPELKRATLQHLEELPQQGAGDALSAHCRGHAKRQDLGFVTGNPRDQESRNFLIIRARDQCSRRRQTQESAKRMR